jgi:cell division protein FtsW
MNRRTPDLVLIVFLILLVGFGLTMVYSASSYTDGIAGFAYKTLLKQAAAVALGSLLAAYIAVTDLQKLKKYHWLFLFLSIALLPLVFAFGGDGAKGAHRWIDLGPVKFQPAEVVKITFLFSLATWFEQRRGSINDMKHTLGPALGVMAVISGLLMAQPDFGSTVVLCGMAVVMAVFAGLERAKIGAVFGGGLTLAIVGVMAADYRMDRILNFLNPVKHCQDGGYQVCQSMAAYHRGGWSGLGWGDGAAKLQYLPEPHNDFIAAVVGEELGLFGFVVLLVLYTLVAVRCWRIATRTKDYWSFLVVSSFTVLTMGQALLNLGVSLGVVPPKGLVLPFISYGASAMFANLLGMGLVLNISSQDPDATPEPSSAEAAPEPAGSRRGEAHVSVPTRA